MKRIITGICIIALLPCLCWAEELTGRDIAIKMDAVDTSLDSKKTAIMVINRKAQKLVRKMESCNKKYGPDERGLIKLIEPPDVRGIMYLTWSSEDTERDDDMWVFLPAESLVRRISGGGKKGSFMRSDFTSNEGSNCEIFAEYKIGDKWQLAPGYMTFNGHEDSRPGQFNDMIYLKLRYSF